MKTRWEWVRRLLPVALCIFALASQPATAFTYVEDPGELTPDSVESTHTPATISQPTALTTSQTFVPNPAVADMMAQVQQDIVYTYTGDLSGEWPALVGGVPYTITTRHTDSGMPIQMATQYVYEHLQASGLAVSYHDWYANRNVVGVLTGTTRPDEIVLITAHLDDASQFDTPTNNPAPGADDNASGSVGVLLTADILSQYQFERTLRFVFFTGEEQGMLGSKQYAQDVYAAGNNIVAVYNMDMIAWNKTDGPTLGLHTRGTTNSGYAGDLAIVSVFTNVVNAYCLGSYLTPTIVADGITASDHASFWDKGYSAILAIEDWYDFNANYHKRNDRLQNLEMTYFTNFVKASVGTAAHLARPMQVTGTLTGLITDADSAEPIGGAQVQAKWGACCTYLGTSDSRGMYTLTLPVGVYSVTGSASGYRPNTISGVVITSTTPSALDILLKPVKSIYMPIVFKDTA